MPSRPNRGKDFETEIKTCFELVPHVSVDRLPDPMSGYSGVRNICDFSVFQSPDTFYIECKCHYGNTLNYKSDIRVNQWDGLLEKSKIFGCVAGVVVWFIDHDITAFVTIQDLLAHRNSGHKSLNVVDITGDNSVPHFLVDGSKKRTMDKDLGEDFLRKLHETSNAIWRKEDSV